MLRIGQPEIVSSRPRTSIMSKTLGETVRPASAARSGPASLPSPIPWASATDCHDRFQRVAVPASILQVRRQFCQYTTGYRIQCAADFSSGTIGRSVRINALFQ